MEIYVLSILTLCTVLNDKWNFDASINSLFLCRQTGTCPEIEGDYVINGATIKVKNSNALTFTGTSGGDAILLEGDYYNGCKASGMYSGAKAEFNYNAKDCTFTIKDKDGKTIASAKKQGCVPSKFLSFDHSKMTMLSPDNLKQLHILLWILTMSFRFAFD